MPGIGRVLSRYGSISTLATSSNTATLNTSSAEWYEDDKMMHQDHVHQEHDENDVVGMGMSVDMDMMSVENDMAEEATRSGVASNRIQASKGVAKSVDFS
ncbi:hypothetical protein ACEPAG_9314 [Sanghuangporus baumii]